MERAVVHTLSLAKKEQEEAIRRGDKAAAIRLYSEILALEMQLMILSSTN